MTWTAILLRQDGTWTTTTSEAAPPRYETKSFGPHGPIRTNHYERIAMDPLAKFLVYAPLPGKARAHTKGESR